MSFDPIQYKTSTRQQWEDAAEAWHRWGPVLEEWLGDATERMLDAAEVAAGSHVLDVAAGAGGQTLAAAWHAGPSGRVVATDISPNILAYATKSAAESGLTNVETIEVDGEALDALPAASFDAVISRVGLIYFPDRQRASRECAARCATAAESPPSSTRHPTATSSSPSPSRSSGRGPAPPPQPGQPGPFSLGGPDVLVAALRDAGFRHVTVETVPAPLRLPSAAECVRFERESFGALHQMLAGVPADERPAVWAEIEAALTRFETAAGFVGPCELLVAAGAR